MDLLNAVPTFFEFPPLALCTLTLIPLLFSWLAQNRRSLVWKLWHGSRPWTEVCTVARGKAWSRTSWTHRHKTWDNMHHPKVAQISGSLEYSGIPMERSSTSVCHGPLWWPETSPHAGQPFDPPVKLLAVETINKGNHGGQVQTQTLMTNAYAPDVLEDLTLFLLRRDQSHRARRQPTPL